MRITVEEKLMYAVMKAIYSSGIPINFKGSMVLKACLLEAGYAEETRHTVDVDANWYPPIPPTEEQMVASLQKALQKGGIDLKVKMYRMYGERRSAGFELHDCATDEVLFTMDIDVNRSIPPTKIYEVEGIRFCGVTPVQMIADKLYVISTDNVFRRIKDLVDLYYISKVFEFDQSAIMGAMKDSGRNLGNFNGFLQRENDLKHSYDKFRFTGGVNKPTFEEVYRAVTRYIKEVIPQDSL